VQKDKCYRILTHRSVNFTFQNFQKHYCRPFLHPTLDGKSLSSNLDYKKFTFNCSDHRTECVGRNRSLNFPSKPLDTAIREAGKIRFWPFDLRTIMTTGSLITIALRTNPLISPLVIVLIGEFISFTLL
jgi:hypothetical protein